MVRKWEHGTDGGVINLDAALPHCEKHRDAY